MIAGHRTSTTNKCATDCVIPMWCLIERMLKYRESFLLYLTGPKVPYNNNLAEQAIRMAKVKQKISGSFRTIPGSKYFARIRSYIETARKQQRDVFDMINNVFAGVPFSPCPIQG